MMRIIVIVCLLLGMLQMHAQDTYVTNSGEITFNASTPLEDIYAINTAVNGIFKTDTGDIGAVLLLRDFRFRKKLMEEHFNENYVESGKYPKATFRGKLLGYSRNSNIKDKYSLEGILTIREISREISATATVHERNDVFSLQTQFIVRPEDFDIRVPRLLFKKIAREVKVTVDLQLEASEK